MGIFGVDFAARVLSSKAECHPLPWARRNGSQGGSLRAFLSEDVHNISTCACEQSLGSAVRDPKLTVSWGVRPLRVDHSHISVSRKFWCCSSLSTPRLLYVDAPILIGGRIFCAKSTTLVGCPAGK